MLGSGLRVKITLWTHYAPLSDHAAMAHLWELCNALLTIRYTHMSCLWLGAVSITKQKQTEAYQPPCFTAEFSPFSLSSFLAPVLKGTLSEPLNKLQCHPPGVFACSFQHSIAAQR